MDIPVLSICRMLKAVGGIFITGSSPNDTPYFCVLQ
jgi:hypothetical protein